MKTIGKIKRARVTKRNLFRELREGMTALTAARQGKRTLRTHTVEYKRAPKITPTELICVGERLKFSRALFSA